jgi:hypothetical protein
MKKVISIVAAVLLVTIITATGVLANDGDSNASAKATAQIDFLHVISVAYTDSEHDFAFDCDGDEILEQTIKTANGKDLFIDVSLQSAVFTGTTVKSKDMGRDTSTANASVFLWVWIDKGTDDQRLAFPGPVVYNARTQTLTAVLQGEITSVTGEEGDVITIGDPEEIGLFIGTMSANSFNFIVDDLSSGMHTVTVDAACASSAMNQQGCAGAVAVIGLGSMTIEEVRMIQGEDAVPSWWD